MNQILCVSAFPERRQTINEECRVHGLDVTFIEAPNGAEAAGLGLKPAPAWRDPSLMRLLTWGELACFAGHQAAWVQAAQSTGGAIIIEDDARILGPLDFPRRGDIVCLGGRFLADPPEPTDGLIRAPYTYWCVGYWISQEAARKLLRATVSQFIVPVDEFIPYHAGTSPYDMTVHGQTPSCGLEVWALPKWLIEPSGRWHSGTESSGPAFELRTAFAATDPKLAKRLIDSLESHGFTADGLMAGDPHFDTSGWGCIQKLKALVQWLSTLDESRVRSIALVIDGYDTLTLVGPDEILSRYGGLGSQIIVGGELPCWPDESLADPLMKYAKPGWSGESGEHSAIYNFPCAGTIIGASGILHSELKIALSEELLRSAPHDEQRAVQKRILQVQDRSVWRVDREAYLFQSLSKVGDELQQREGYVFNTTTRCYPAIIHDNGPTKHMDQVIPAAKSPEFNIELASDVGQWLTLAPDVLGMPFLTAETAAAMAEAVQSAGPWQPLPGDNVPGDELRVQAWNEGCNDLLTRHLTSVLKPIVEEVWRPARWRDPKDLFFIRFSRSGQPQIRLHEDKSYLSCSIKLRGACSGGELWFPRQNFSDSLIAPGWLIIWPSEVTHPHRVLPVKKGKRVSIVVWT